MHMLIVIYALCPNYGLAVIKIKTGFTKLKPFYFAEEFVDGIKKQDKDSENIFENHISDKDLRSIRYVALLKLNG